MSEAKKSVKMKFKEDKFVDGVCVYDKDVAYDIPAQSVDRWLKRGGEIVPTGKGSDKKITADLDASLAQNLEKDGKGTHDETEEAAKKAALAGASDEGEDADEESEDDSSEETSEDKPKTGKQKSGKQKNKNK